MKRFSQNELQEILDLATKHYESIVKADKKYGELCALH